MAAADTPAAVLRVQLAAAREAGCTFDQAWPGALDQALQASEGAWERAGWQQALTDLRGTWRAAYARVPASDGERALAALAAQSSGGVDMAGMGSVQRVA